MTVQLDIAELARRCGEETARYLRREAYSERFCLELFRRAVVDRDQAAWEAVHRHFSGAVRRWLGTGFDDDGAVAATFERFWHAVDGEKFARFGSLAAVLQYLKMCGLSTRLDRVRAAKAVQNEETFDEAALALDAGVDIEAAVLEQADATALWDAVRRHLTDERERRLVYLSYVLGLTPRGIRDRYTADYPDVVEIYRLKRGILERLRKVPEIAAMR